MMKAQTGKTSARQRIMRALGGGSHLKKKTRRTEFGDIWSLGSTAAAVHRRLGNSWWAWTWWVITLEQSARYIGEHAFHTHEKGELVMAMPLAVRAMLLGYAIECALKGLWVRRGNKIVQNGKYVGLPGVPDHDLAKLSKVVGFSPTTAETAVLNHLTKFIRFAGRYPIAKTPEAMVPCDAPRAGPTDIVFFSKKDFRMCITILNKIGSLTSGKKRRMFKQLSAPRYLRMP